LALICILDFDPIEFPNLLKAPRMEDFQRFMTSVHEYCHYYQSVTTTFGLHLQHIALCQMLLVQDFFQSIRQGGQQRLENRIVLPLIGCDTTRMSDGVRRSYETTIGRCEVLSRYVRLLFDAPKTGKDAEDFVPTRALRIINRANAILAERLNLDSSIRFTFEQNSRFIVPELPTGHVLTARAVLESAAAITTGLATHTAYFGRIPTETLERAVNVLPGEYGSLLSLGRKQRPVYWPSVLSPLKSSSCDLRTFIPDGDHSPF
jgi:hypothetical protein